MKKVLKLSLLAALGLSVFSIGTKAAAPVEAASFYDANILKQGIPSGYYDGLDLNQSASDFKDDLYDIISANYVQHSYKTNNTVLKYTDPDKSNNGNIICFYTGRSLATGSWNKEHVWAKSHGFPESGYSSSEPYSDAHHLRPTLNAINSSRGNSDFGEVSSGSTDGYGNTWTSSLFEPRDEVKGDVARIMFYMAVRYGAKTKFNLQLVDSYPTSGSTLNGKFGNLQTLLKWHYNDPVSNDEIYRNNVIYTSYQKNRNPFIDHPEYVDIAFPNSYSQTEADQTKVNAVIDLINQLPDTVTLDDEAQIVACDNAYQALTTKEKQLVTNYSTLSQALATLNSLKNQSGSGEGTGTGSGTGTGTGTGTGSGSTGSATATEAFTADFANINGITAAYTKGVSATLDGRSYYFSYAYKSGSDVRLGYNKETVLDSKYNPTSNSNVDGAALELQFDVENASSITFTNNGSYGTITGWYILFSQNNFSSFEVIGQGNSFADNMSGSLSSPKTGRFALVIVGSKPRLQLGKVAVFTAENATPSANLETSTVSTSLGIDYTCKNGQYTVTKKNLIFTAYLNAKVVENADYYMIYTKKANLQGSISETYTSGTVAALANSIGGTVTKLDFANSTKAKVSFEANVSDLYTAVIVCEYEGQIIGFSNETTYSIENAINYYLDNNIITDAVQLAVLKSLLS